MPLPPRDFSKIGPSEGERFPDVVLPDQAGRSVDLHAARAGRKAIVAFYRSADWRPYCKAIYLRFVEGHAEAKFREAEKAELLELATAAGTGDKVATD